MFCENSFLSVSRLVAAIASRDRFTRSFCFSTMAERALSSMVTTAPELLPAAAVAVAVSPPFSASGWAAAGAAGVAAFVLWLSYCLKKKRYK